MNPFAAHNALCPFSCMNPFAAKPAILSSVQNPSMASSPTSPAKEGKKAKKMKKDKSYSLRELKDLGMQLLSSMSYINNAPILLSFISPSSPPSHALESLMSLQSFFIPLLPDLPPSSSAKSLLSVDKDDPESVYRAWIRSKFDQFVSSLIDVALCSEAENVLRDVSLDAIMEFVKQGKGGTFQSAIYHKLLHSIVHVMSSDDYLLDLLVSKFFKYIDVRYFTYISLAKLSKSFEATNTTGNVSSKGGGDDDLVSSAEFSVRKMYGILSQVPPFEGQQNPDFEMWSQSGFTSKKADHKLPSGSLLVEHGAEKLKCNNDALSTSYVSKKMKSKFTEAWTSFLRLPLPLDVYKEVLVSLHQMVIPYIAKPTILCDFLTRSYDIGGVISVMALSSFFILMTQHGLEYPNFYEKLYGLLVPAVFMAKHRARFFQLLDSCLKSSLLPAYLAAAFAKKLSRLALSVPPSGALVIIALIHNLLRRHPSINCLVHQQPNGETGGESGGAPEGEHEYDEIARQSDAASNTLAQKPGIDPFNNEEGDPAKSNAMRSSLWEIDTLHHHYCPAVSRFVASLENDLTVRAKTSEITVKDFSSGSYATIFRDEIRRRIKQVPLEFYKATPTALFSESDFPGWTFGFGQNDEREAAANITGEPGARQEDSMSAKRQKIEHS